MVVGRRFPVARLNDLDTAISLKYRPASRSDQIRSNWAIKVSVHGHALALVFVTMIWFRPSDGAATAEH